MLHYSVELAFDDLLCNWRAHEVLNSKSSVPLRERAASRIRLDKSRERMHQLRLAIHPEPDEAESALERVWCDALETVVHLRWVHRHPTRPGNFTCPCGELIPIDWGRLGTTEV